MKSDRDQHSGYLENVISQLEGRTKNPGGLLEIFYTLFWVTYVCRKTVIKL